MYQKLYSQIRKALKERTTIILCLSNGRISQDIEISAFSECPSYTCPLDQPNLIEVVEAKSCRARRFDASLIKNIS